MIYLPDTNIFSEISNMQSNQNVVEKMMQHRADIRMASTVWHELAYGVAIMPHGKKRQFIYETVYEDFAKIPVFIYDKQCAEIHAQIRANCRKKGKTLAFADSQIASIAMANNAVLVTRNVSDFEGVEGLTVENWFE